jgi:hypothetical protein
MRECWPAGQSSRGRQLDAFFRADVDTKTTAVAIVVVDDKLVVFHSPGVKMADVGAESTIGAGVRIGCFDRSPLVAFLFRIQEIPAAVIAAKADAVGLRSVVGIAERPRDETFDLGFAEYFFDVGARDLMHARTAAAEGRIKNEADIHPGARASAAPFAAAAVGNPKTVAGINQPPRLLSCADIMEGNFAVRHRISFQ